MLQSSETVSVFSALTMWLSNKTNIISIDGWLLLPEKPHCYPCNFHLKEKAGYLWQCITREQKLTENLRYMT